MSTKSHPCPLVPVPRSHFLLRLRVLRALGGEIFGNDHMQQNVPPFCRSSDRVPARNLEAVRAVSGQNTAIMSPPIDSHGVQQFAISSAVTTCAIFAGNTENKTPPIPSASSNCHVLWSGCGANRAADLTASSPGFCARKLALHGKLDQSSFSGRLYTTTASAVQDFKPQIAGFLRKTLVPSNEQRYSTHAYTRDVGPQICEVESGTKVGRQGKRTDICRTPGSRLLNPSPGFFPPSCNSEHSGR